MSGRVEGKVAFITGVGRGQGRSHAVRLAQEGADIIGLDLCSPVDSVPYGMATPVDLEETVRQVESAGRRMVAAQADVREPTAVSDALSTGVAAFGGVDIVCANAGVNSVAPAESLPPEMWRDVIDIDLTGVWNTCQAALPHLRIGGSIILTSSIYGLRGAGNMAHYVAAKHGVVGITRALVQELSGRMIRVNCVHPGNTLTPMLLSEAAFRLFRPDLESPAREDAAEGFASINTMPLDAVEPLDISNAVLFLASEEARYVTGATLPVDLGAASK